MTTPPSPGNFARGKELFSATACASCHRMAGEGGGTGPDLTGSGSRYTLADLLENIVEPSKVISDQYGSETITGRNLSRPTLGGSGSFHHFCFKNLGGEIDADLQLVFVVAIDGSKNFPSLPKHGVKNLTNLPFPAPRSGPAAVSGATRQKQFPCSHAGGGFCRGAEPGRLLPETP